MNTVVSDFPSGELSGEKGPEFTQWVRRLQPSVFEYQVWSGRCFFRMWWDRNRFQNNRYRYLQLKRSRSIPVFRSSANFYCNS